MSKIKSILVGDSQVGKTSIITQLVRKTFDEEYIQTIAGDKSTKDIELSNGKTLNLEIWDTAGQEIYRNVNKIFMKNAKIVILVYDMTSEESFKGLNDWYKQVIEVNDKNEIQFGVVANKSDLYEDQKVNKDEAENYAKSINAVYGETSALDYDSVYDYFKNISESYDNMVTEKERLKREEEAKSKKVIKKEVAEEPISKPIVLENNPEPKNNKKNGCC